MKVSRSPLDDCWRLMNIARLFTESVKKDPHKIAFVVPEKYDHKCVTQEKIYTYGEFAKLVSQYRLGLTNAGFKKGDRIILLTPLDIEFYAFMMAMMSLGIVSVFLDPGIGRKKLIVAIVDSGAQAVISIDRFFKYRFLIPQIWKKKLYSRDSKGLMLRDFNQLKSSETCDFEATPLHDKDHLLITFTSGSTGRSKGADRNALNVFNQINSIKENWACGSEEIDFPSFPMFGFLNLCFGITTVLPPLDFSKVGEISPECVVSQMEKWKVTRLSGSSTFLGKISNYLIEQSRTIQTVKNSAMGGAPVTKDFCRKLNQAFPQSENVVTYGSTEVAPISFVRMQDVVDAMGDGALVGKVCKGLTVSIVRLPKSIPHFDDKDDLPYRVAEQEWGEVIIKGPHVVQSYVDNPGAVSENKISTVAGDVWHRTGDVGHYDQDGNLWLTGRLSELVTFKENIFRPYIVEGKINTLSGIKKSALLNGKKGAVPVLFIEASPGHSIDYKLLAGTFKELGYPDFSVREIDSIPVDDRHNSKIDRIKLEKLVK